MKAFALTAGRRRDQVVILSGVRPGSKLSTRPAAPAFRLSPLAAFALSMVGVMALGAALLACFALGGDLLGTALSAVALAALVLLARKGGAL